MQAFNEYVRNIMYIMVFIAFIGIIVPDGGFKKYIDLVLGLFLIIVMVQPLAVLLGEAGGFEGVGRMLEGSEAAANMLVNEAALADLSVRMMDDNANTIINSQLQTLMQGSGYALISSHARINHDLGEIRELKIVVHRTQEELGEAIESQQRPLIRVERVVLRTQAIQPQENISDDLYQLISDFYNISIDNIHIQLG